MPSLKTWRWLLEKEIRELAASRSYWLLLLVVGALVGHALITSVNLFAEASGIGGGPAALSQGLNPLDGIVVPTWGAYDLAATLLFPFVVIRLFAEEKETGALSLTLQAPASFAAVVCAKTLALVLAWLVALVPGVVALALWRAMGGHLGAGETTNVVVGHLLRGLLTIGIGAASAALAASAASAAIVALTITLGTWALDYVAAARGGAIAAVAAYTPSAALRVFEQGQLRVATVLILITLGAAGLAMAAVWLNEGRSPRARAGRLALTLGVTAGLCLLFGRVHRSFDVSEDRRSSFPPSEERVLMAIREPLRVTIYLAAEDPRLTDLETGVLTKLRRTMHDLDVIYAANSRSGLFEQPGTHYGEIWYSFGDRREMSRSTSEPIVLETIYHLAGREVSLPIDEVRYPGYPLAVRAPAAPWVFFVAWPLLVGLSWWHVRRPRIQRLDIGELV